MKLKVCGMKHRDNISELLQEKPDYMGLIFYDKSPRFVEENEDTNWIKEIDDVQKVGVFVNASSKYIQEKIVCYGLQLIQLHGKESPSFCEKIKSFKVEVIKVFSVGEEFDMKILEPYEAVVDYFLFDTKGKQPGGNGVVFNWEILQEYTSQIPFFLSGGIGIESLDQLKSLNHLPIHALDVNSKFELEPARKDIPAIRALKNKMKTIV